MPLYHPNAAGFVPFTHNPGLLGHSQLAAAAYQSLLKELSDSDTSWRQDALSWNLLAVWSLMCLS